MPSTKTERKGYSHRSNAPDKSTTRVKGATGTRKFASSNPAARKAERVVVGDNPKVDIKTGAGKYTGRAKRTSR